MNSDDSGPRLTTIVMGDVAGYTKLVANDEAGTLAALRGLRSDIVDPKIAEFGGRLANTAGDSYLIEFRSATDALKFTVGVQDDIGKTVLDEQSLR